MPSLLPALATMLRLTARFSPSLATYLFNSFCTALSGRLGFTSSALFERATGLEIPLANQETLQSAFALWAHRILGEEPQETIDEIFGQGGERAQAALLSALRQLPKHEICSLSTCAKEAMSKALTDDIKNQIHNQVLTVDVLRCLLENPSLRRFQ
jgi:hypothetical protein